MATTLEELTAQIKDRLDIVDVVSKQVILKKNGGRLWGLCPFHKEKTPSFSVNPSLGIYKCFGCGEGGDSLAFIMKTENKDFMEVIKEYAERFHLEMPDNFKKIDKSLKNEMIKAYQAAAEFYKGNLSGAPLDYLTNRGMTPDIINKFQLGLATNNFYGNFKDKFSAEVLEKAGLVINKDGRFVDRFRNRIMIPIHNEHGEVVAFGARAIEKDQVPKYLNSSDSIIYNKSKLLYGLYTAKDAIKEQDCVILMEGYFDVIAAQANGIENCVASCGTSLTPDHIKLLSRYTNSRRIYLSFDTDSAGQKATERNAELIKEAFCGLGNIKQFDESYISTTDDKYACEIRVIAPPEGKDPDEFIRSAGAEKYKQFMQHAPLLIDFQFNNLLKEKNTLKTPQDKVKLVKKLIPVLHEINNEITRGEYVRMAASALDLDETSLLAEIRKMNDATAARTGNNVNRIVTNVTKSSSIEEKAQKNLLSLFLVTDSPVSHEQLREMTATAEFSDQTLINVKTTLEKISLTVNNTKGTIERLFTEYAQDPEMQKIITELISISETFQDLTEKDFTSVAGENIQRLNRFRKEQEHAQMRELYRNVNTDDPKALEIQMQLRDTINRRQLND
jgi:DNA primase